MHKEDMTIKKLQTQTKTIAQKFPKEFDKKTRFIDLVEEIGELANAILIAEKDKPKNRAFQLDGLKDSLCDVLADILLLASDYNIDLDIEYQKMLQQLEERITKGEFTPDK